MKRTPASPTSAPPDEPGAATLEFWRGGEIRSENIGPADGEHLLGVVDGPGLWFWVGENAAGKSQHLALLAKLHDQDLLRQDAHITHGQLHAFFQIARTRVTFRRAAGGGARAPRFEHLDELPRVEELPGSIWDLINGGGFEGSEERFRARLRALLEYAPIEADDKTARALCRILEGTAFDRALPRPSYRDAWAGLVAEVGRRMKRFRAMDFEDRTTIERWLLAEAREGILEDQKALAARLNALGNVAEKAHAIQLEKVAEIRGVLEGQLEAAGATEAELKAAPQVDEAQDAQNAAERALARIEDQAETAEETRREREALRASHGEKPDVSRAATELAAARTKLARASKAHSSAAAAQQQADDDLRLAQQAVEAATSSGHRRDVEEWLAASAAITAAVTVPGTQKPSQVIRDVPDFDRAARALDALRSSVEIAAGEAAVLVERQAAAEQAAATTASKLADLDGARRRKQRAEEAHQEAESRLEAWNRTAELLASTVEAPTEDALAAAREAAEKARANVALARCRRGYEQQAASLTEAEDLAEWLEHVAEDYRQAARDTWAELSSIVTRSLDLPWLAVEGTEIKLYYDIETGRLAESADAEVEERDMDSVDELSVGELHEACLRLMLTRREKLGGILIVNWVVLAALDEERLASFSADCKAAGLVVFAERPRRRGDPEDLVLEKVEPRSSAS